MNTRLVPGWALVAFAVTALAGAVRLIALHRVPDGALAIGLALALASCGVMWLLVELRRSGARRARPLSQWLRISQISRSLFRPE